MGKKSGDQFKSTLKQCLGWIHNRKLRNADAVGSSAGCKQLSAMSQLAAHRPGALCWSHFLCKYSDPRHDN